MFTRKPQETLPNRLTNNATTSERPTVFPNGISGGPRLPGPLVKNAISQSPQNNTQGDGVVLIGKNTKIMGDISNCTMIEIQGTLEGTIVADAVVIREGGGFRGTMQTDKAEVHGVAEGSITVHELLDVRSSGNVTGELTYGRLAVADGGNVSGNLQNKAVVASDNPGADNVIALNDVPQSATRAS
jgi:cytoskeletal protein CcmA (bactofilin family)